MSASIRVGIADDQELVRTGLRAIMSAESDIEVVGEADDGVAAIDLARQRTPDVLLMDIRMPNLDGIEATRRIVSLPEPPRVVILTTFDRSQLVYEALCRCHRVPAQGRPARAADRRHPGSSTRRGVARPAHHTSADR
jgi:chemotaxis response regulator CheB